MTTSSGVLERPDADAGQPGTGPAHASRPRILVVDDDPQMRLLARRCLQQAGFEVHDAPDATHALAAFQERRPDLVLCDVLMPGMDGFDLCRALRALPDGEHVPVVMMTGLDDLGSIEAAYAAGATEFSIKPLNFSLLPRHIRFILKASATREELRRSEERYALAARGANDGLWDWDLDSGVTYFSPRWLELLGLDGDEQLEPGIEAWLARVHRDDAPTVREQLAAHLDGGDERYESEHRMRHADGVDVWVQVRGVVVRDRRGRARRLVGSMSDITERKSAIARLQHNALHDVLTGLPNRALFADRLGHCMERCKRHPDSRFAVMFIDLDRFKLVNDSLGHPVGDRLLVAVGERLARLLRSGETLARFGGDEFAVLVEDIESEQDAQRIAARIHVALRRPVDIEDHTVITLASIGIAYSGPRYECPEELLRDADVAMFAAKARGSGNTEVFRTEMHVRAVRTLELERELRSAVASGQIDVDYQPIVSLESERICGFEALVRWNHPIRGRLPPAEFLGAAVDSGLIVSIGHIVLESACAQLRQWQDCWAEARQWSVSVNISAPELLRGDLVEVVERILERTGLEPRCLKLEVTETSVIENLDQAREVMDALHARDIRLSVDDFGSGFSSFSYLQKLPFDALKIDRSFISQLSERPADCNIVQAMVRVAHALGMEVVAEGNATANTLDHLRELHCEYAQSDFFARALSSHELASLLDSPTGRALLTGRAAA